MIGMMISVRKKVSAEIEPTQTFTLVGMESQVLMNLQNLREEWKARNYREIPNLESQILLR